MGNERVADLLCDLVAIPSVNPVYDPASSAEAGMADYVEAWAAGLGLPVARQAVFPGRDNVIVRLDGAAGGPTLLMEAHMDTVGVTGMTEPFAPAVRDGNVYGRGACDTKGSLAAMMAAVEMLATERDHLAATVVLLAAVDEETSGQGARAWVAAGGSADAAVIGEPTELRLVNRHNGCVRGRIVVSGVAAHTSVAREGINAIDAMADVIVALRGVNDSLTSAPGGQPANGSLTVSLVEGGAGINIVPERCEIQYDRRTVPGGTSAAALAEIDAALDRVRVARPEVGIEREEPWLVGDSLSTAADAPVVRAGAAACASAGLDAEPAFVPYGSDASKIQAGGIPAIVFGPGSIAYAHSHGEFVPVSDLLAAATFYRDLALALGAE